MGRFKSWAFCMCTVIGATLFPELKGEVGHLRRANGQSVVNSQCQLLVFADFFIHCALPIGGERIAGPVVLALHKGNQRIGKARTTVCSASSIVIEIAN
jgi:hypothetical protein